MERQGGGGGGVEGIDLIDLISNWPKGCYNRFRRKAISGKAKVMRNDTKFWDDVIIIP